MSKHTHSIGERWNKKVKKELLAAFKGTRFTLDFGNGYLNIRRSDGVNCEFYPCYQDPKIEEEMLTARYTVFEKEQDIDVHIPNQTETFVKYVKDILRKDK